MPGLPLRSQPGDDGRGARCRPSADALIVTVKLSTWGPSLLPAAKFELLGGSLGMAGAVVALVVLFAF